MSSDLSNMRPPAASRTSRKRVGRGVGSGLGKTCGRGQKGQKSRSGGAKTGANGFEGGQMPLQRRLPKRGFINRFRRELSVINVRDLTLFESGATVGPEDFLANRMVRTIDEGVKVLAVGEITHPITVKAHAFSIEARRKIEAAGGTVLLLSRAATAQKTPADADQ